MSSLLSSLSSSPSSSSSSSSRLSIYTSSLGIDLPLCRLTFRSSKVYPHNGSLQKLGSQNMKQITHFHLGQILRLHGGSLPLPLYTYYDYCFLWMWHLEVCYKEANISGKLAAFIFKVHDEGSTFSWNVCALLPDHTLLHLKR
jgi:hypothetical protein